MTSFDLKPQYLPNKSLHLANHLTDKSKTGTLLSRRYEHLLRSENYCDCIFLIGSSAQKCHKLILSAASPVFEAMFFGPIREQNLEIEILDISPEIFKVLIDYIYMGWVDYEELCLQSAIELYYSAEKYLLRELRSECLLAISGKLRFANILPALELSVCMDLGALTDICMSFFTRCCLRDSQFMSYLNTHYLHISKDCIKTIIAAHKDSLQQLLWFVYEWCQQECNELGLKKSDLPLILDDLQLKESGLGSSDALSAESLRLQQQVCTTIERVYCKAMRPFVIDFDNHTWRLYVRSNRFIVLYGLAMHSRLTPLLANSSLHCSTNYKENFRIEISRPAIESEDAHEEDPSDTETIILKQLINLKTEYNCDTHISWNDGVVLSPDVEYQIRLIWPADAFGAEYPCSLMSNKVDGIIFKDSTQCGSIVKGLRFTNLISYS